MGAAIIRHGRVLVARRTDPPEAVGGWEFPGGKVEPGEDPDAAVVREIREELCCEVTVTGQLSGESPIRNGYVLSVRTAELVAGEPIPHEHGALRWLGPEELCDVDWMTADLPFLTELRALLLDGHRLAGGRAGGPVRIGRAVRRATGPWTPSVHALLDHLAQRGLPCVPRVLGQDERGREVLSFLPGRVLDVDHEVLNEAQLVSLVRWTRDLHAAVAGFDGEGPWLFSGVDGPELIAHNRLAPYSACFEGDELVGIFGWNLAGPSTRLLELAGLAWHCVPLTRDLAATEAARRLELIASTYGGPSARQILDAVPRRVPLMLDGIPAGRSERTLADLVRLISSIEVELS